MFEFNSHINGFLNYLSYEKGFSKQTISAYKCDLEQFMSKIKRDPKEIKKRDIDDYAESLRKNGYEHSSISRKLAAIKTYYKYLVMEDILDVYMDTKEILFRFFFFVRFLH